MSDRIMLVTGITIRELEELFSITRSTVYRALAHAPAAWPERDVQCRGRLALRRHHGQLHPRGLELAASSSKMGAFTNRTRWLY
jgi:hypothetical protein